MSKDPLGYPLLCEGLQSEMQLPYACAGCFANLQYSKLSDANQNGLNCLQEVSRAAINPNGSSASYTFHLLHHISYERRQVLVLAEILFIVYNGKSTLYLNDTCMRIDSHAFILG